MTNVKLMGLYVLVWSLFMSACSNEAQEPMSTDCRTDRNGCSLGFICREVESQYQCVQESVDNDATLPITDAMVPDLMVDTDLDLTTDLDPTIPDLDLGPDQHDAHPSQDSELAMDIDDDGVNDDLDNCPLVSNSEQVDSDDDGLGNQCDQEPTIQNLILNGQFLILGGSSIDTEYTVKSKIMTTAEELTDGQFILTGEF